MALTLQEALPHHQQQQQQQQRAAAVPKNKKATSELFKEKTAAALALFDLTPAMLVGLGSSGFMRELGSTPLAPKEFCGDFLTRKLTAMFATPTSADNDDGGDAADDADISKHTVKSSRNATANPDGTTTTVTNFNITLTTITPTNNNNENNNKNNNKAVANTAAQPYDSHQDALFEGANGNRSSSDTMVIEDLERGADDISLSSASAATVADEGTAKGKVKKDDDADKIADAVAFMLPMFTALAKESQADAKMSNWGFVYVVGSLLES